MPVKNEHINRFIYAMFTLMQGMKKGVEDCCETFGNLSEKEFAIIHHVGQVQQARMSEVASAVSTPLSTVTSIVDRLVGNHYLVRYHSNEDRRVVFVTLGKAGKETFQAFLGQKHELAVKILSRFRVQEQQDLIRYLEQMAKATGEINEEDINYENRNIAPSK